MQNGVLFIILFYASFILLFLSDGSDMLAGFAIGMAVATLIFLILDMIMQYVKLFKKEDDE